MAIGVGLAREPAGFRAFHPHPAFAAYVPEVDLPTDDDRYALLRLVDPYDETVWSSYQCHGLEAEFERLAGENNDPQLVEVLDLVRRCAADVGSSLWFLGD